MLKVPFNSSDAPPPPLPYMKHLPLHHNTSGPGRKYMLSAIIYQRIYFFFHPCVLNLVTLTLCSETLTCLSVCPAVIVLSVHILKDTVLKETACCRIGCRSAMFLMIAEIVFISEHPSGTRDCCLGPFYLNCYHICLIFVCIVK